MTDLITTEPCPCGHPKCRKTFLVGIGSFVQGSGFTPEEAKEIVRAVNAARRARVAAKRRREPRKPDMQNIYVTCDGRRYRVLVYGPSGRVLGVFLKTARSERVLSATGRQGKRVVALALESENAQTLEEVGD